MTTRRDAINRKNDSQKVMIVENTDDSSATKQSTSTTRTTGTTTSNNRRQFWFKTASQFLSVGIIGSAVLFAWTTRPVWAKNKSRTAGYAVQKTEAEWKDQLSSAQYYILRQGGTERPFSSVLESEKRSGIFQCAGCGSKLFSSQDKFNSGTGWPSFARGLPGGSVETEDVDAMTAKLVGAELRCATCGGHLGDVFQDGFLFPGTEAFKTGKRYCIDGYALVFYPDDGTEPVRGDA